MISKVMGQKKLSRAALSSLEAWAAPVLLVQKLLEDLLHRLGRRHLRAQWPQHLLGDCHLSPGRCELAAVLANECFQLAHLRQHLGGQGGADGRRAGYPQVDLCRGVGQSLEHLAGPDLGHVRMQGDVVQHLLGLSQRLLEHGEQVAVFLALQLRLQRLLHGQQFVHQLRELGTVFAQDLEFLHLACQGPDDLHHRGDAEFSHDDSFHWKKGNVPSSLTETFGKKRQCAEE
jgi:hypothetical protein